MNTRNINVLQGGGNYLLTAALCAALAYSASASTERMLRYTSAMITDFGKRDWSVDQIVSRMQDGQIKNESDAATYICFDFGASYHITKIVYAGRPNNVQDTLTRLRGCEFKSSTDGITYTTFHTVPSDYALDYDNPQFTTVDLVAAGTAPTARFFYAGTVRTGSWDECQFWTDSDVVLIGSPDFSDESASGATTSVGVTFDGDFDSSATATLTAYVAASDLGGNLADWQSGATVVSCGSVASGGTWSGTIPSVVSGGNNYVRFYATAETSDHNAVTAFSGNTSLFVAANFAENRPLVESSASMLTQYNVAIANVYKAFDNNDTTVASGFTGALDYGRPVRIDRIRIVASGANSVGIPIQVSQDGWTWQTVTNRIASNPLAVNIDLASPVVARYIRYGGDGQTQGSPQINEVRTYALAGTAFVAVTSETETHTAAGLVVSGTVTGENLAGGTSVSLYGYVGPQDYGVNKAAWDAAGITPTLIGQYQVGANFTTPALTGTANATSGVRYGAVVAVASGAASSMGTAHPFTLNNEAIIDITQDMVVTNYSSASANLANTWKQGFFGNGNLFHIGDNLSNGAATFDGKKYRITMIEWQDRQDSSSWMNRATKATFRIYTTEDMYSIDNCRDIASASSAWGASDVKTYINRWNAVAPAEKAVGYGVGIYDAGNGNGYFRFWGRKVGAGFTIYVR